MTWHDEKMKIVLNKQWKGEVLHYTSLMDQLLGIYLNVKVSKVVQSSSAEKFMFATMLWMLCRSGWSSSTLCNIIATKLLQNTNISSHCTWYRLMLGLRFISSPYIREKRHKDKDIDLSFTNLDVFECRFLIINCVHFRRTFLSMK